MMMLGAAGIGFVAPADSAKAVATMYTTSLLATLPIVLALIATALLRRAGAEGRTLVWRSAIVALLLVFVGRQLPFQAAAWDVPSALASPLVALGRVQVTTAAESGAGGWLLVRVLLAVYVAGVGLVLVPTIVASIRARMIARRAGTLDGDWRAALDETRTVLGISRQVRLIITPRITVPMTWGFLRPVVAVPESAAAWDAAQMRIVLLHELAHVRASDWLFNILARAVCAVYWFHPGAWWIARRLREDCELACDDRVIASGVRRSDYAELLVAAAEQFLSLESPRELPLEPALGLARRAGLRARLAAVLDVRHDVRPLRRGWVLVAVLSTVLVAGPMSVVQLAPARDVLTALMSDARWESRAYAVMGLAARADSVAVARTAAELDPNPRVRAWARYALRQRGDAAELRAILHQ